MNADILSSSPFLIEPSNLEANNDNRFLDINNDQDIVNIEGI